MKADDPFEALYKTIQKLMKQGSYLKGKVWSKIIVLCMACFSIEDSRGDECRAKFSLVHVIATSKARR